MLLHLPRIPLSARSRLSRGRAILAALALLLVAEPAPADLILQAESFGLTGLIGSDVLGFEAFDPALGTLDRVSVTVIGTFTFPILLLLTALGLAALAVRHGRGLRG